MKRRLLWTKRATRDLLEIGDFIAARNPKAARSWIEGLRHAAAEATELPFLGRKVPELDRDDVREVLLKSYRIVYRVAPKAIIVLTVFEGHRLLPLEAGHQRRR